MFDDYGARTDVQEMLDLNGNVISLWQEGWDAEHKYFYEYVLDADNNLTSMDTLLPF